jgi:anti-sigma B factor antagonist
MDFGHIFEIEHVGRITVLNLRRGVEEIQFDKPPADVAIVLDSIRRGRITDIVVDCHDVDFLRSTALGFFVTLWKRVENHGGRLVFCNVSEKARQILHATKLDHVWRVFDSRVAAVVELDSQPHRSER